MTIVFKVNDNIKKMMIEHYKDRAEIKTPPYAIFQVKDYDCVTTLYESGKVVFQGIGADIESSYWVEQERILNNNIIDINNDKKKDKKEEKKIFINESSVGSDEVGTGDYFGPIVVTATYVSKENIAFLTTLGVRDSKKLTDEKIMEIAPDIIKKIPYSSTILTNKEYNDFRTDINNMNKIKAILHNKCLVNLLKQNDIKTNKIVIDQFEPPKAFYKHIASAKERITNVLFLTKAEDQCLSVASSSIISRYIFLNEIKKLEKKLNIAIPLGASTLVDEVGQKLVSIHGKDILNDIAKLNFKNTQKILNK